MKRRLLSPAPCGILPCGTPAGYGESETPSTSQEPFSSQTAEEPKILTIMVNAELNTLYPFNMGVQNNIGTKLCYESLVNYENGEIVPYLVESQEFLGGGKALTFYLREGVTFHDGTPSSAGTVKTDFKFARPDSDFSNIFVVAKVESIEVVDEYMVTSYYPGPHFAYLMDSCHPRTTVPISPTVLGEGNYQSTNDMVDTGPCVYEEIVDGNHARFIRDENYWGEQPYYDKVIVKHIPDTSAWLQAFQSGEIDLIYGNALLTWDDYQQATSPLNIVGAVAESDSKTRNLVLSAPDVPSDSKVCEAAVCATNRETLSGELTYGEEALADYLFSDGIPYMDVKLDVAHTYDPEKANAFLDEAGWVLNESTGIREKDGQAPFLKHTYDSGDALNEPLVMAVRNQLAAVGISVKTEDQEMMTWWQKGVTGNYDLIMWNTEQSYTSPHSYLIPMLSCFPHVPNLPTMESNDELLSLIGEFQTTDDGARAQEIPDELPNFDNDSVLDLPLLFVEDVIVYNTDKIAGYDFSSTPMLFDVQPVQPTRRWTVRIWGKESAC